MLNNIVDNIEQMRERNIVRLYVQCCFQYSHAMLNTAMNFQQRTPIILQNKLKF